MQHVQKLNELHATCTKREWEKVASLRDPDQTDELRRLAVQLALQLPASVADARRVLELTGECLDQFLIERSDVSSAAARARRIWGRPAPAGRDAAAAPQPSSLAVLFCCVGVLAVAAVAGAITLRLTGYGAVGINTMAVSLLGLLFGWRAALGSALAAFLLTSWAVIPPALEINLPTTYELFGLALSIFAALVVPWIQARREPLREASLRVAARPLRALGWRRAA